MARFIHTLVPSRAPEHQNATQNAQHDKLARALLPADWWDKEKSDVSASDPALAPASGSAPMLGTHYHLISFKGGDGGGGGDDGGGGHSGGGVVIIGGGHGATGPHNTTNSATSYHGQNSFATQAAFVVTFFTMLGLIRRG